MLYNSCVIKYSKIYMAYGANLGEYFYFHIVHFNSCVVKYSKIYRAYGANLGEYFYLYIVHFMCLSNAAKTTGHMVL